MTDTREAVERLRRNFATTMTTADALEALAALDAADARVAELEAALQRQCDNMAFILNRVDLHNWHDKFERELAEDRAALEGRQP